MQTIKLRKGLDIPFEGTAAETLGSVRRPEVFHIVPDQFAGITPKLDVKVGDRVKAGSPLFHDKAFEEMLFTAPVSGEVKEIVRGDRRKILSIDILADTKIEYEHFGESQEPRRGESIAPQEWFVGTDEATSVRLHRSAEQDSSRYFYFEF